MDRYIKRTILRDGDPRDPYLYEVRVADSDFLSTAMNEQILIIRGDPPQDDILLTLLAGYHLQMTRAASAEEKLGKMKIAMREILER